MCEIDSHVTHHDIDSPYRKHNYNTKKKKI